MHNYKELKVWQKAVEVADLIYDMTDPFPKEEKFGLTNQIRKSAVSISSNIGEGAGRLNDKEFIQFLGMAYGSSCELDTQMTISKNRGFINEEQYNKFNTQLLEIQKMIFRLIDILRN